MTPSGLPVLGIGQRLGWWMSWRDDAHVTFNPAWLDMPVGWILCAIFGIVVLTSLLHAARGLIGLHARAAKTLLVAAVTS